MAADQITVKNERTGNVIVVRSDGSSWDSRLSEVGAGAVVVDIADWAQITKGDMLTFRDNGVPFHSFIAEQPKVVRKSDRPRDLIVEWSGRSVGKELSEWILPPPNGSQVPVGTEWRFDWASAPLTGWDTATVRGYVYDKSAVPPYGVGGLPSGFPNPLAGWIAPRAAVAATPDPAGVWYAGVDVTLTDACDFGLWWLALSGAQVAVDGVVVDEFVEPGRLACDRNFRRLRLSAGDHEIRVRVAHEVSSHPYSCSLFACGYAEVQIGVGITTVVDWLGTSNSITGWKTLDYDDTPPGFTWGQILETLVAAAQADGGMPGWTLGFNDTVDSAAAAWPVVQQRFDVGMSLLEVLEKGVADGQIMWSVRPGTRVLDVWLAGTEFASVTVSDSDLTDLVEVEDGSVPGRVRYRDSSGFVRTVGSSGPMVWAEMGSVDPEFAPAVAAAQLARLAVDGERVTCAIPAGGTVEPVHDFWLGDVLTLPGVAGTAQVVGMPGRVSDRRPTFAPVLRSQRHTRLELAEVGLQRVAPGLKSVALAPTLPGQPAAQRMTPWERTFSWSGPADEVDPVVSPPWELSEPTWLTRMEVLCNAHGGGSTTTKIELLVNGSPLPTFGVGVVELGTSDVFDESWWVVLGQVGDVLQMRFNDFGGVGKHESGTVKVLGATLEVS